MKNQPFSRQDAHLTMIYEIAQKQIAKHKDISPDVLDAFKEIADRSYDAASIIDPKLVTGEEWE